MTAQNIGSSVGVGASAASERAWSKDSLADRARRAASVADQYAEDVDKKGRFPAEAFAAIKAEGLLGVMVPKSLGGEGASHSEIAEVCYALGQACASTGMIYAMHQVKVACVVRHYTPGDWQEGFLQRLVERQLLLASSTTEGQAGGNVRSSAAAVSWDGDRIRLDRDASVISYGAEADGLVTTARRAEDAANSDQVLLVLEASDYVITLNQGWETLGMRGTASTGFDLKVEAPANRVMAQPYAEIHAQSMVPAAHIFWSSTWAGVASAAAERARKFVRKAARAADGAMPPAAAHYAKAASKLRALRSLLQTMLARYEAIQHDPAALSALEFQTAISLLKVDASELALESVMASMRVCGLSGYRNDNEASIGRHLRDILSAPIMINNDRILSNLAASSLMAATPQTIGN